MLTILAINAAVLGSCFVALWLICLGTRDVTPVDSFWAWGMLVMAASTYVQAEGDPTRMLMLLAICGLWAARLGSFMLWRWRSHGRGAGQQGFSVDGRTGGGGVSSRSCWRLNHTMGL